MFLLRSGKFTILPDTQIFLLCQHNLVRCNNGHIRNSRRFPRRHGILRLLFGFSSLEWIRGCNVVQYCNADCSPNVPKESRSYDKYHANVIWIWAVFGTPCWQFIASCCRIQRELFPFNTDSLIATDYSPNKFVVCVLL